MNLERPASLSNGSINVHSDEQLPNVVHVLIEALKNDPLFLPLVGGDSSLSKALFTGFFGAAVVGGEAYFAQHGGKVVGAACWFGPGQEFLESKEQLEAGWNLYYNKLSQEGRMWQTEIFFPKLDALYAQSFLGQTQSKLGGYHLALLGVLPPLQGRGIGKMLIQEVLGRAHRQRVAVCLDTYTDLDVSIYKHWGFQVRASDSLSSPWGEDFLVSIMVWEPNTSDSVL